MPLSLADFPAALGGTLENVVKIRAPAWPERQRRKARIVLVNLPPEQQIGQMLSTSGRSEIGLWLLRLRERESQERLALAFEPKARR